VHERHSVATWQLLISGLLFQQHDAEPSAPIANPRVGAFLCGAPRETELAAPRSVTKPIIRADVLDGAIACVRFHFRLRWMLAGQDGVEQLPDET
jgi:hypothetical protein